MPFPKEILEFHSEKHDFTSYTLPKNCKDVYFSKINKGTFIPSHDHGQIQVLNFIAEGKIETEINDHIQQFNQGDWCVIQPNVKHTLRALQDSHLIEFWIEK